MTKHTRSHPGTSSQAARQRIDSARRKRLDFELLENRTLLSIFTVTEADGGKGAGTLFDAITQSNTHPNIDGLPNLIDFAIGNDSAIKTISLKQPLPFITAPVIINAETQQGYSTGSPHIVLDGHLAGACDGLVFHVGGNTVEGLVINNFHEGDGGNGFGIVLDGGTGTSAGSIIQSNFIGTDASGTLAVANSGGINILGSTNNLIGGLNKNDGRDIDLGNLISGNDQDGIFIANQAATNNKIEGNFIGTDITGMKAIANGLDGIAMLPPEAAPEFGFASANTISNFDDGSKAYNANGRNVISGNTRSGVYIVGGTNNVVQGNYIGVGADGVTVIPNLEDGVRLEDANSNSIGGTAALSGNTISANKHNGIEIVVDQVAENLVSIPAPLQNANDNVIQGNFIGTDATGAFSDPDHQPGTGDELGNGQNGVSVINMVVSSLITGNIIGGSDADDGSTDGTTNARNLISGNLDSGISMAGAGVLKNQVEGNFIGTDESGKFPVPNAHFGVLITGIIGQFTGPSDNSIGGTAAGAGNVISSNGHLSDGTDSTTGGAGIELARGSLGDLVVHNIIGTDPQGLLNLGNLVGVFVENSAGNIIGGALAADQNVIVGSNGAGVVIDGGGAHDNLIQRNLIGVSNHFSSKLGNAIGVQIAQFAGNGGPVGTVIGGTQIVGGQEVSLGNVISANLNDGIAIQAGSAAKVVGNIIGTDLLGTLKLGNGLDGIHIVSSSDNLIGGSTPAARNEIVNNGGNGIDISDSLAVSGAAPPATFSNQVRGNYIGIGFDGVTPQPNGGNGVLIDNSASNSIDYDGVGTRNVISGNMLDGVRIEGVFATVNTIAGDFIGTSADGLSAVPNGTSSDTDISMHCGVVITDGASANTIGLPGFADRNVISGNTDVGVELINAGTGTIIQNNYVGLNADGTGALLGAPQQRYGIIILDTPGTTVGADSFAHGGNVVSGNQVDGLFVTGVHTTGTRIMNNHVGTDKDATISISNVQNGVNITAQPGVDGSPGAPGGTLVSGNIIAGYGTTGLTLNNVSQNTITGNFIGTNDKQIDTFSNFGEAILLSNSPDNTIGGTTSGAGNTLGFTVRVAGLDDSMVSGVGMDILGAASLRNVVLGDLITKNSNDGLIIEKGASRNVIGNANGIPQGNFAASVPGANNIIDNGLFGIRITDPGTTFNLVVGNLIGIDRNDMPAGNASGISIENGASSNVIGSAITGFGNVISASLFNGVFIGTQANGNSVLGNYIGTNRQRVIVAGFGNHFEGITIASGSNNAIGGETSLIGTAPGNVISGNGGGIGLSTNAAGNEIEGNLISDSQGFKATDESNLVGFGVDIAGSNNTVGGLTLADANAIARNLSAGVFVESGTGNAILGNGIFSNGGLGIDLAPLGDSPNQPRLTVSSGANNLQNTPELTQATIGSVENGRVTGSLDAAASTSYTLQFFEGEKSKKDDGSEEDDAKSMVLSRTVTTNKSGIAVFAFPLPDGSVSEATVLRATATDPLGNTSELSDPITVAKDSDDDGVSDADENRVEGDFSQQPNVVTIPNSTDTSRFVTLALPAGLEFRDARSLENPSPDDAPDLTTFDLGFFDFTIVGLTPGQHVAVQMTLPEGSDIPTSYWRYGDTPSNPFPHWFDWLYNPLTDSGAEIKGTTITLHFVDGARGDEDLTANGQILDAGAPGFSNGFTVTNTADSGDGSLRQAILNSNANAGLDEITFVLPGAGPFTIRPLSPLPAITDAVSIDGLKLPSTEDSDDNQRSAPAIILDGSLAGTGTDGLVVASGIATIQGLVIDHFSGDGIRVITGGGATIEDNFIGADVTGTTAAGNGSYGVEVENNAADDGDDEDDDGTPSFGTQMYGNVISANGAGGVFIHGVGAVGNDLEGNWIGTQADGVNPLGNLGPGVLLDGGATVTSIGSGLPDGENTIAFNHGAGVDVRQATGSRIRVNSIFGNSGLAIDLGGDGVTPNDTDDSDEGADDLQNFPVLTHVDSYGGYTFIDGTLTSAPDNHYIVEFYSSAAPDPTGFGPGQTYLGMANIEIDDSGNASFNVSLPASISIGSYVTATASPLGFDTSEFSAAIRFTGTESTVFTVNTADDANDAVPDAAHFSLREAILAANSHPGQDVIHFALQSQSRTIVPLSALPAITDPLIIDGTSQPGYAGLPLVEIDGENAGTDEGGDAGIDDGLTITGGGSIVRGLVINRFLNSIVLSGLGGNRIEGNFLGTDLTGTRVEPNAFATFNLQAGVNVNDSPDNLIGGTTPAARNVIFNVIVQGDNATGNRIEGNYIDIDVTGTAILPADVFDIGIRLTQTSSNTIGGLDDGDGNVIGNGVFILNGIANLVQGNLIGTDFTGTVLLVVQGVAAGFSGGVEALGNSSQNVIGGTMAGARNIMAEGVVAGGSANKVQGNYIGTDITGTVVLEGVRSASESGIGVELAGTNNLVGGPDPGAGNLISGFQIGVEIDDHFNRLEGNFIGTDVSGTKPLGNGTGVVVKGFNNTVGGTEPGAGNVISGNGGGLSLVGAGGNIINGNFIGTDLTGRMPIGNGGGGIYVSEPSDLIGGTEPGAANVISANGGSGISIDLFENGFAGSIGIVGNFIGTDVTGTMPLGNSGDGVTIHTSQNIVVGGSLAGAGNVISANGGSGVHIDNFNPNESTSNFATQGNAIQGNKIGTDVTGTLNLGNAGDGVTIVTSNFVSANVTVGGTNQGEGNEIAFNHEYGVDALSGSGNLVRDNDIFANGELGIVTDVNDALGTYAEQRGVDLPHNAPILTSAVSNSQTTAIQGTLTGIPISRYSIDLFASDSADPSGFGEGQHYLRSIFVVTDPNGSVSFDVPLDLAIPIGQLITATATVDTTDGNTSGFSQALPVVAAAASPAVQFTAPTYLVTESGVAAVVVVTRVGSTAGTAMVDYSTFDGSAKAGTDYTAESGTLTFNDGEASKPLTIPIQDNAVAAPDTSFGIILSNAVGVNLGSIAATSVTIADDDSAGQIAFRDTGVTFDESDLVPPLVVTRTGGSKGRVTVGYTVTGGTATPFVLGDNSSNTDYRDFFGTLDFEDGQTTAEIPITTFDEEQLPDNSPGPVFEGPETINVSLGNPTAGATLGPITQTVVTINDDDDKAGGFEVGDNGGAVEGAGPDEIKIVRTGLISSAESVDFTTRDGSAKAGVDYTAVSGTVSFAPFQQEKFIEIPILSGLKEGDPGSFDVVLSNPTGGAILVPGHDVVEVSIVGNDSPESFSVDSDRFFADGRYNESAGTATINIDRTGGTRGTVTVDYATSDGTATAGSDYTATSGTLTFNDGETVKSFTVPITPDNLVEGDETFFVTLSNPTGGASIDDPTPAVKTIYEVPSKFNISSASYQVAENSAVLTVSITLDIPQSSASDPVTVAYSTQDGTAKAGADYTAVSGMLTFTSPGLGPSRQTITIPILNDAVAENTESFSLILSNPTDGASLGADSSATITILDDDVATQTVSPSGSTSTTVPTTTVIHASGDLANVGHTVTFVAVVTPASGTGIPTGTVLFTIDGTAQTPVSVMAIDGQVMASITTTTLAAGVHKIQATYSGDASFSTSTTSSSFVATAAALPPTVTSLVRFGIHMQPTVLVLAFSAPLDSSTAQDVANYRITGPEHGRIAIKSAIYDPTRNTVTLKPKHRIDIHYAYHVMVIGTGSGGVRSTNGILLDGAGSHVPGSNYITTLDCRNLAITGVEARKVLHLKHVKPGGALIFPFASRKGIVRSR